MKSKYKIGEDYICECGRIFSKSQSLNAHFSRCKIHRNGLPPIVKRNGGGWNKGKNAKEDIGLAKMAATLSINLMGHKGVPHSVEMKRNLSEKRIKFMEEHPDCKIKWYTVSNGIRVIKVQGIWEEKVAKWLNKRNINWERVRIKYDNHRTYTPDFWLPDFNFYIEVKGLEHVIKKK